MNLIVLLVLVPGIHRIGFDQEHTAITSVCLSVYDCHMFLELLGQGLSMQS